MRGQLASHRAARAQRRSKRDVGLRPSAAQRVLPDRVRMSGKFWIIPISFDSS